MQLAVVCDGCFLETRVGAEHAGKRARCKNCGTVFRIPRPGEDEPSDLAGTTEPTPHSEEPRPAGHRNGRNPGRSRKKSRTRSRQGTQALLGPRSQQLYVSVARWKIPLGIAVGLVVVVGISGLIMPAVGVWIGRTGFAGGIAVSFVCGLWILVLAFQEDPLCGVLYLFLPFYALYYVVTRWEETWFPVAISAAGGMIAMVFGIYLGIASSILNS
jgi:hypothetical protein